MKKLYIFIILIALFAFIISAMPISASQFTNGLTNTADVAGYPAAGAANPANFLAKLLGSTLTPIFLAVTGIIIFIYAGYTLMTARGDEQKVEKAKDLIKNTVMALIVAYSAFAILKLIIPLWKLATTGSMTGL
ncbi:MAG: hypothetical protein UU95_C0024G0024 [Parcubacteria group bacterium GW2011_GWC2_42_12]|uniref:TrbC/VIRB2 family protein n=2 Tax=Candidatus Falkowiibacteriota TaxID=1752728 RepID=A0A1F5S9N2_9BACT|nr:MAG: hypothetical protein UU43_C0001G0107 [Candidatus Falkowbacteria bacterium GW2011_GWA2_41_14]KKS33717.1 MAG: hypothetical protein UU95_C0024G0024 [Parcubacteria group bacterium GW2011_GWC2_42_12]OGF23415.1 MAG: hypothetical protein A3D45_01945 [Candidatus Falkowbacteria bacterium RIFCSPHIGHO2_02_FULL_42_9]